MLAALAIAAGAWVVVHLHMVLLTLLVALVLAGTLAPAVAALERRRVPRAVGIATIFVAVLGLAVLLGFIVVPALIQQLQQLVLQAPAMQTRLVERLAASRLTVPLVESVRGVRIPALAASVAGHALAYPTRVIAGVAYFVTAVVIALYMVADRDRVRGMAYAVVPRQYHLRLARIMLNPEGVGHPMALPVKHPRSARPTPRGCARSGPRVYSRAAPGAVLL